jgi:nucleotide-binding universal stress UspA family protein
MLEAGKRNLHEAFVRAQTIDPYLEITACLRFGAVARAVLQEARQDALIVLARAHGAGPSHSAGSIIGRVARHARCPVVIAELFDSPMDGQSAGQVVVGFDGTGEPMAALIFAFRSARRRGVGVTVLHTWDQRGSAGFDEQVALGLSICRGSFPGVDVRQRLAAAPTGPALVAESAAAALVVLGLGRKRIRGTFFETASSVVQFARCPLAIVKTPGRRIPHDLRLQ